MDAIYYWGTPTASLDWCEKNYVVCNYIAEFWNTITSMVIALLGLAGCYLTYRERIETRFTVLYSIITVVGLGSVAFHATLLIENQLLDELPMLWGMLGWIYVINTMRSARGATSEKDKALAIKLVSFGVIWTLCSPWVHQIPIIFQALFVGTVMYCVYNLHKFYHICENQTARKLYVIYNFSVVAGALIWLVDKEACNVLHEVFGQFFWHKYVGSLHGYWHLLMAANVYAGPVFGAIVRSQIMNFACELHWWFGIIPYARTQGLKEGKYEGKYSSSSPRLQAGQREW